MSVFDDPAMTPVFLIVSFLYGALFGSFFNVCIYRIPLGMSVGKPVRSFCFECGSPVRSLDNIPLISYWLLKGRCRDCGAPFSMRYFLVELLTACLFTAVYWFHGASFAVLVYWVLTGFLVIATFTDLDHWIIMPSVSIGGAITGLVLAAATPWLPGDIETFAVATAGPCPVGAWWGPVCNGVIGAVFGFGLLWFIGFLGKLVFRKDAMGGGDLRLFACVGAFLGWGNCLWVLFAACIVGAVGGIALIMIAGRRETKGVAPEIAGTEEERESPYDLSRDVAEATAGKGLHHVEFGPYIAVATYVVMLFHRTTEGMTRELVSAVRYIVTGDYNAY